MSRRQKTYLLACILLGVAAGFQISAADPVFSRTDLQQQEDPLRFARSLYQDGLYDLAVDQLRRQLAAGLPLQHAEEGRWLLARALEAGGRTTESANAYLDFTDRHGSSARAPEGWLAAGRLFMHSADYDMSADAFRSFLDLFPVNDQRPRASVGLIEALLADQKVEEALIRVREAHRDYPFHPLQPRFILLEARVYSVRGESGEALRLVENALDKATTPDVQADAAALKARLLVKDGRAAGAIEAARTALSAPAPAERVPYLQSVLGQALEVSGLHQEALPELRAALAGTRGREKGVAALWLARAQAAVGETDSALVSYDIALSLSTGDESAAIALEAARTARGNGALTIAVDYADHATREATSPGARIDAVIFAADLLQELDRAPAAKERYLGLLEEAGLPDEIRARAAMELGRLYERRFSNLSAASAYYRLAAISLTSGDLWAEAIWASSHALASQGEYASAIVELGPLANAGGGWGERATGRIEYWRQYHLVDIREGLRALQEAVFSLAAGGEEATTKAILEIARANAGALKDFGTAVEAYDRYLSRVSGNQMVAQAHLEKGRALESLAVIASTEQRGEEARQLRERAAEAFREAVRAGETGVASEQAQLALIELDLASLRDRPVLYYQAMRDRYRSFLEVYTTSDRLNEVLLRLGEANEGLGQHADTSYYSEAASVYRLLLEGEKPQQVRNAARYRMGRSLYRAGLYDSAAVVLESSLSTLPENSDPAEALFMAGDAMLKSGNNQAAVVHFRELDSRFPESIWTARSSESTGDLLMEEGRAGEAVTSFRRFMNSCAEEERGRARYKLATALAGVGEWQEGLEMARLAAADSQLEDEMRLQALMLWGEAARFTGQEEQELTAYRTIWLSAADSPEAFMIAPAYGDLLSRRGDLDSAEDIWSAIAARTQSDSLRIRAEAELVYLAYAGNHIQTGEERKSAFEQTYRRRRDVLDRFQPLFWAVEGEIWIQREEWDRAERALNQIIDEVPDSQYVPGALYGLGVVAARREDVEEARRHFQDLVEGFPDDPQADRARTQLANLAFLEADYETAMSLYRTVTVSGDPVLAEAAQYNLVKVLEHMEYFESAQQEALTYLERYPESESAFDMKIKLGILYHKGGQLGRAAQHFRTLQAPDSEGEARIRFYLAEALFSMGNYQEAVLEYMKVAILNEDQFLFAVTARLNAADCYAYLGQRDTAIDLYQQIIVRYGADSDYGKVAQEHLDNVRAGRSPRSLPPPPPLLQ